MTIDPAVVIALRAAVALLLAWSAIHKLRDIASFRTALSNYELLPRRMTTIAAAVVVAAEFSIAVSLPFAGGSAPALSAAVLLAIYTAAIVINFMRGRIIDCGCSGPLRRRPLSSALIARNCLLLMVALIAAVTPSARELAWLDIVTVVGSVAVLTLLYGIVDQIAINAAAIGFPGARGGPAPAPSSPQALASAIGGAVE
jgi:hypothetical protein